MTTYALKIVGWADGAPNEHSGRYVVQLHWNPVNPGLPVTVSTPDPHAAAQFPDLAAALSYWRRIHPTAPVRPDGRPNRPGTAHTCELVPVPARPDA